MNSEPNVFRYIFDLGFGMIAVGIVLGLGIAVYSTISIGDLRAILKKDATAIHRLKLRSLISAISLLLLITILLLL